MTRVPKTEICEWCGEEKDVRGLHLHAPACKRKHGGVKAEERIQRFLKEAKEKAMDEALREHFAAEELRVKQAAKVVEEGLKSPQMFNPEEKPYPGVTEYTAGGVSVRIESSFARKEDAVAAIKFLIWTLDGQDKEKAGVVVK